MANVITDADVATIKRTRSSKRKVIFKEGEAMIDAVRDIVKECQHAAINGVLVDLFTASVIVKVYDAVNDNNKRKLEALSITRLASVCMKAMR